MGRGECGGSKVTDEDEVDHDPSHTGPIKNRSCTDVLCLLLLLVFAVGWGVISVYAFLHGNPVQLIYPSNSKGEICGTADNAEKPYLLFFDLTRCIKISAALSGCVTPQVCVAKCPDEYWSYATGLTTDLKQYCTGLSPGEFEGTSVRDLVKQRKCPAYILPSTQILGRCVPTFNLYGRSKESDVNLIKSIKREDNSTLPPSDLSEGIKYLMKIIDLRGIGEKLLADLATYWWILLIALFLAMILSFVWIVLLRYATAPMIWLSILLCVVLLFGATAFSWLRYVQLLQAPDDSTPPDDIFQPPIISSLSSYYYNRDLWLVLSIALSIFTFVMLVILIFLRSRIKIAIELIEEASKAIGSNMTTLFFPIGPFIGQGLVIVWFCLVASFLASSGQAEFKVLDACRNMTCTNPDTGKPYYANEQCDQSAFSCPACPQATCVFHKFGPSALESGFQVYNLFGLFWFLFFIEALGEMVLAGVFAGWYWTFDKENNTPNSSILSSLYRTVRYHLGTLAFGSLILSIVRMIRVMIEYVEDKLKKYGEDNPVVKAVACLCKCCFYCLENFIKFINRNAYIMTAVYGNNFCSGARRSFSLLARNMARVVVLDKVTDFILFIGKLIVVSIVLAGSVLVFRNDDRVLNQELNYQLVPVVIIVLSTYAISCSFFSVYNMAVDTIFLSFLEDLEKHDGSPDNPYFMDEDLMKLLGKKNDEEKGESEQLKVEET